ncbi:RNA polymerase sigma factor sigA-like [Cynara cardunculus var. scolymus]|uniref:RNA polymerase sigma-70 n=1 Tax=Cynara cardunculus var. scolymus TaxID=59895 RepID=A0A118K635_CYNCS|nr:RNA polymerase sigma factor sigA-like [Cynara cardunculus var. scolymus]KVI10078.1 RNA polymerase sigma-70 [Cynara cardunculus var. scolymus]
MMSTTAVVGLRAVKMLLGSSPYYSDVSDKLSCSSNLGFIFVPATNLIASKKSSNYGHGFIYSRDTHSIRALKEHVDTALDLPSTDQWVQKFDHLDEEVSEHELSVEALLLLHKSLLEKQWTLSTERTTTANPTERNSRKVHVTGSGISARRRRIDAQNKTASRNCSVNQVGGSRQLRSIISPELLQNCQRGYLKGVRNEALLTHSEVVALSEKIKIGLHLEEEKSRLKERLGTEPSEKQLATSLQISQLDLQTKQTECTLAREKLALSNVRLVMSVAQKYKHMGADMSDLIQGGLIGLLRGIEKYDSSRGHKISTYVYWWIRQGVTRTFFENSKTLRLPTHLHERLGAIRNAKSKLERKGITPSIDKIAESLKMSRKKVTNATEAVYKVFSLDKEAFPSLNGLPGDTLHSYIADDSPQNNPWHGVDEGALKDEVRKLITMTLGEREREIIHLYYGLDNEYLTWEDISRRKGLSRERVRQVGLVALEKLKHAARNTRLAEMLGYD